MWRNITNQEKVLHKINDENIRKFTEFLMVQRVENYFVIIFRLNIENQFLYY